MKQITFGSVCSGIEAASMAWEKPLGWKPLWFSEIEPFPCEVLKHHYPHVPNLGDMTTIAARIKSGEVEAPDILVGGTPCFTADHLVLAAEGYKPIQDILPGDMVVTHEGRLKKVVRIGSKMAKVGKLTGVGISEGIVCTPKHKFLTVDWSIFHTTRNRASVAIETCGEPTWEHASDIVGKQYCSLMAYDNLKYEIPQMKYNNEVIMYLAGMYLGDGSIQHQKGKNKKKAVVLSLNRQKYEKFINHTNNIYHKVYIRKNVYSVVICDTILAEWLINNFLQYSYFKKIPIWVFSNQHKNLLLQGYIDTDGCKNNHGYSISTVSKKLAYGVSDLFRVCGYVANVHCHIPSHPHYINGNIVNESTVYSIQASLLSISSSTRKSRVRHGYMLRKVKSYEHYEEEEMVYNIEVEDDHSYVLNGVIVSNCQAFSLAGARKGLSDPRGQLSLSYVGILNEMDNARLIRGLPESIGLWENVKGVFSSSDNGFGCFLAALAGEENPLQPAGGRWTNSGCVFGKQRKIFWRTLDAQFHNVPQRRQRVFLVASSRDDIDISSLLFEFEGKNGDSTTS